MPIRKIKHMKSQITIVKVALLLYHLNKLKIYFIVSWLLFALIFYV